MTSALAQEVGHAEARPISAEIDLDAITDNVALLRAKAGRPVKLLMPVKANAYGHGVVEVSRHLQRLGVDGLATANVDDAVAVRRSGVTLPILLYGAQLPGGNRYLLQHGLTPSVYDYPGLQAIAAAGSLSDPINVHVKVDAGMGRLGVRLDECATFVRDVLGTPGVHLEGIYTHIPFSDGAGEAWSRRRLQAFADLVHLIETDHGITIDFAQAAASSVFSRDLPDSLNTISPGHLTFGLHPLADARAEAHGFRKALRSLRAQIIHIGRRRVGDDLPGCGPTGLDRGGTVAVILFGMDNGYRQGPVTGDAFMLCHGCRCTVLGVSAEYTVIDVTEVHDVAVGDTVTVIGADGDDHIAVEDVAAHVGAPSAAYWMVGLKNVPYV